MLGEALQKVMKEMGALNTGEVNVSKISFIAEFRKACESNACGMYGKCWTCPPCVGEIDELIAKAKEYKTAIVYQTVHEIEDSYDFEGMQEGGDIHNKLTHTINEYIVANLPKTEVLHLSAGGCRLCKKCAKRDDLPCRFPEKAVASLESYGVAVSELASLADMKYINGQNTVTYFGAVLLK